MENKANNYFPVSRDLMKTELMKEPLIRFVYTEISTNCAYCDLKIDGYCVKPGQMVTSYRSLSKQTGISEPTIRRILKKLKSLKVIDIQTITSNFLSDAQSDAETDALKYKKLTHKKTVITNCFLVGYYENANENRRTQNKKSDAETDAETDALNNNNIINKENNTYSVVVEQQQPKEKVNWEKFTKFWNEEKSKNKARISAIDKMTDKRKKLIRSIVAEYGKEKVLKVVSFVMTNDYYNGRKVGYENFVLKIERLFSDDGFLDALDSMENEKERQEPPTTAQQATNFINPTLTWDEYERQRNNGSTRK